MAFGFINDLFALEILIYIQLNICNLLIYKVFNIYYICLIYLILYLFNI